MNLRKPKIIMNPSHRTPAHDILDSDDELPDSYCEETMENPAYLNDLRFDDIVIPWLENCKPVKITKQPQEKPTTVEDVKPIQNTEEDKSKILISHGVLSTGNLFLVKSIAEYCSESTLIWFIESLKQKSVQDRFHKSCLAKDFSNEIGSGKAYSISTMSHALHCPVKCSQRLPPDAV